MPIESQAVKAAARLNAKFSVKDLGDWDKGIKEACDHLGLSAPKVPNACAALDLSLERMLLELRDDLGEEKEALGILFGNNQFLSEMGKKFPRGGELRLVASSFPDGSVMAWLRSDKAKLGRMACLAIEAKREGVGQRLLPRLSAVNMSRQGGLELEEQAHLSRSQGLWGDLLALEQMPASSVSGMDKGHAVAKWLKGASERFSMGQRSGEDEVGQWKEGVSSMFDLDPKAFAELGSCFEVWSDFKPENLLGRLRELAVEVAPATRRAPRAAPAPSKKE